jgi:hypothetical protein
MEFYGRDIQIVRQSQSKMVLEYTNSVGVKLTVEELQRMTDIFVECCIRPQDKDLKERIKNLDKWLSEKQAQKNGESE